MVGLRYGSTEAAEATERWLKTIARAAYLASVELAREKGAFPLFEAEPYLASGAMMAMDDDVRRSRMDAAEHQHGRPHPRLAQLDPFFHQRDPYLIDWVFNSGCLVLSTSTVLGPNS